MAHAVIGMAAMAHAVDSLAVYCRFGSADDCPEQLSNVKLSAAQSLQAGKMQCFDRCRCVELSRGILLLSKFFLTSVAEKL